MIPQRGLLSAHAVKDQPVETEEKSLVVSQKLKKEPSR